MPSCTINFVQGQRYSRNAREAANESKVHVCMEVESMEILGAFMSDPENAKVIEEAGGVGDSAVIIPLVD